MKRFFDWLSGLFAPQKAARDANLYKTGSFVNRTISQRPVQRSKPKQAVPDRQPEFVDLDPRVSGSIQDTGPGKNVLIRNKYVREDSGTHDSLKILDDSMLDTDEAEGFDPYNTGQFDRSRNWEKRTK
jgi:hypothetical protein